MKKQSNKNISYLLKHLPLQQGLRESHATISRIAPKWKYWSDLNQLNTCSLAYFKDNQLTINCESAIYATHLMHQQQRLLDYLHLQGFTQIKRIKATIKQALYQQHNTSVNTQKQSKETGSIRPSGIAITSLAACEKTIKNKHLSNSLLKLIQTLKEL